jgi:hypothetical protein
MARATRTLLLLGGDYAERLDRLYAAIEDAQSQDDEGNAALTMMEAHPVKALEQEYQDLKAEAEAEARQERREVKMLAVGRRQWRELKDKYPPRTEGSEEQVRGDRMLGLNTEAAEDDVVYASICEPEFKSRDAFDEWADDLSPGEWKHLAEHAWGLAIGVRFDPKSPPGFSTRSTS